MLRCFGRLHAVALVCAAACLYVVGVAAAQEPRAGEDFSEFFPGLPQPVLFGAGTGGEQASPYWIGVGCEPAPAVLRAQLKLAEDEGLVVVSVSEGSPAAAAGVQVNDVLVAAGDKPLKSVADLVRVVDEAKEAEITLKVVRGGEARTLAVRPAKRPEQAFGGIPAPPAAGGEWPARVGRALQFVAPGVVVGGELFVPKDMSVTITLEHNKPARFVVKKGDKTWEVEQDKLNDLPPEVRGPVQGLLLTMPRLAAGVMAPRALVEMEVVPEPATPAVPRVFRWFQAQQQDEQLEQRLEELKQQIDELRRAIEELSKKQAE
ncbi:MAG: PDZ domain-containing protein [Pirellulales bacterium]|nr:PDZ domain-containing protein [Pirellulales bacterium]